MYMGRISSSPEMDVMRELQGARVLITGLSSSTGVDVARAFADLKARLVVHTAELSPDVTELFALLSQSAAEIRLHTSSIASADAAAEFARTSAQSYGGLDAVINFATISAAETVGVSSQAALEGLVSAKLTPMAHLTRIVANRMRLVLSDGLILNVLTMPHTSSREGSAVATVARATLTAMTQHEARAWADQGVRINAVGPRVTLPGQPAGSAWVTNEPDLAALALYLASRRGRTLSGHIFDADGISSAE